MNEHKHEWWYQPPVQPQRLNTSRMERGDYWYCNVGDHNGCRIPGLDSGCREVTFTPPTPKATGE